MELPGRTRVGFGQLAKNRTHFMLAVPTAPESAHAPHGFAAESSEGCRAPERLTYAHRVQSQRRTDREPETQALDG